MPQAQYGPIKVPEGPPDDRFVYLSDVLPTAWQAVEYADVPDGGSLLVLGLGPIGEMSLPHRPAPRRRARDRRSTWCPSASSGRARHGVQALDLEDHDDIAAVVREQTDGRGPDAVIDAVGMEAHGAPVGKLAHRLAGFLPDAVAQKTIETAGIDRLSALHLAIELVRRGGTSRISGVYGGAASPMPLIQMFDKQITDAHGPGERQALDRRHPAAAHGRRRPARRRRLRHPPRAAGRGAAGLRDFQKKQDGAFKVLLKP